MEKVILVEDAVLRDTFWNAAIDLKKENDELKQRIKRLERAGDDLESWLDIETPFTIRHNWKQAKETP